MAYERTNWTDGVTPLSATNLNNIEEGLAEHKAEIATDAKLGHVRVDGVTLKIKEGVISTSVLESMFYYKGNEYTDVTGGFNTIYTDGNQSSFNKTPEGINIKALSTTTSATVVVSTNNKVSCNNIKKLFYDIKMNSVTGNSTMMFILSNAKTINSGDIVATYSLTGDVAQNGKGLRVLLDVATLNGEYFIHLKAVSGIKNQATDFKVLGIWGEWI